MTRRPGLVLPAAHANYHTTCCGIVHVKDALIIIVCVFLIAIIALCAEILSAVHQNRLNERATEHLGSLLLLCMLVLCTLHAYRNESGVALLPVGFCTLLVIIAQFIVVGSLLLDRVFGKSILPLPYFFLNILLVFPITLSISTWQLNVVLGAYEFFKENRERRRVFKSFVLLPDRLITIAPPPYEAVHETFAIPKELVV